MKRIAVIDKEKCNPIACGNFLCIRVSPGNRIGKEVFFKGPDGKAAVNEALCTDAESITAHKCPFGAIHMIRLPEQLTSRPVHRYGKDGFILYNLPVPQFGAVVGVIGVNGVGKSTAIQILAGLLKPNFGSEHASQSLAELFKGTEAQHFFQQLAEGKIVTAYKPQQVDFIPKKIKGTVRSLLEQKDERSMFTPIVDALELHDLLDNDISQLSGGELQRLALALTMLKKANVYIFDEPTSYLDIRQRLKLNQLFRELATEDVAVLVIDHDLLVLDALADVVYIMYGVSGAYGIVSSPHTNKVGINAFLDGFIKADNMRFRDHQLTFQKRLSFYKKENPMLVAWDNLVKQQGRFTLRIDAGHLEQGKLVGIVGQNGIGKTTFARILARELQADEGNTNKKIKIAFKPQYLSTDADILVQNYLQGVATVIIERLQLQQLLLRQLNQLSGGELQRVAIAKCLGNEADLYLLDEPSAYLDVEQRIAVSRLLREQMEQKETATLVIDHDLAFIDYLADALMVFEGTPAREGRMAGAVSLNEGMNAFLSSLSITIRKESETHRPRMNKKDSQMDKKQKEKQQYYVV